MGDNSFNFRAKNVTGIENILVSKISQITAENANNNMKFRKEIAH